MGQVWELRRCNRASATNQNDALDEEDLGSFIIRLARREEIEAVVLIYRTRLAVDSNLNYLSAAAQSGDAVPQPTASKPMCHNGHTLCSTYKTRVHNRCPTCRQELGDIRCLALEKVAESLELPCKYCSLGCPEIFPYYSKLKHEAVCNFRPYNCPYAGSDCSVVGDIPFLVAHLRDDHKVFHCFGQYFCLHFEAFQLGMAPVYMAFLRFMGDETEVRNYTYSLEVGGNGRKIIWEGNPRSIRDSHKKVRDSHDGLIIQRNMALFFSGGDRKELKLRVTGRIWKEQQNPEGGACIIPLCS
ncbi:hypothetical protein ACLB2K_064701 [Fragaria x ananassa]